MSHTVIDCATLTAAQMATARVRPLQPAQPQWARLTKEDVSDPENLRKMLENIRADIATIMSANSAGPFKSSIIFRNLAVTTGVAFTLRHNFARRAFWCVIDNDTQLADLLYATGATDSALTLTPYTSGIISVLVFC